MVNSGNFSASKATLVFCRVNFVVDSWTRGAANCLGYFSTMSGFRQDALYMAQPDVSHRHEIFSMFSWLNTSLSSSNLSCVLQQVIFYLFLPTFQLKMLEKLTCWPYFCNKVIFCHQFSIHFTNFRRQIDCTKKFQNQILSLLFVMESS